MLGPLTAIGNGLTRLFRVKRIVVWLWLANVLFTLPLVALVAAGIASSIRWSRAGESLLEGLDLVWHTEYRRATDGVADTLEPSQVGVGAFLDNLELWFSGGIFKLEPGLVAAGCVYGVLWALLLGGALAYLQSGDRPTLRGFMGFGGEFFGRFVRVALVMAGLYYALFRCSKWLFGRVEQATRDVTVEKTVLGYYLVVATGVVLSLVVLRMISDYAKTAIVMEDRRSALLAVLRGARFIVGKPFRALALVAIVGLVGLALLYGYHLVAPGTGQASWAGVAYALLIGQLFLIARLGLRLTLLGSQLDLYERTSSFGGTVQDD